MMYNELKAIAEASPYGFTVRLSDLTFVTTGYSVAYAATQNGFGNDGLRAAIDHAESLEGGGVVGGWLNQQNGRYYFDSVRLFTDRAAALAFARENDQLAIWHFDTMSEIRLD